MVEQDNSRKKLAVEEGRIDAPRTVVLFHGYTGSPDDFGDLPQRLARELDARVIVPLLPGHGTRVEDLLPISFDEFIAFANSEVAKCEARGVPYAIGGHSFGSYLAAISASAHKPAGLFLAATPFNLRFPLSMRGMQYVAKLRALWKKHIPEEERVAREKQFFYKEMPGKALSLVCRGNAMMPHSLSSLECPLFTVHTRRDPLSLPKSGVRLTRLARRAQTKHVEINAGLHGLFFGDARHEAISYVVSQLSRVFDIVPATNATPRVAAVVPSYNEVDRVSPVLDALSRASSISEIIVVDDGSEKSMDGVRALYPHVRFLRHEKNRGKAAAMETGALATDAEYIFFCDADLVGLKPEFIQSLVNPVVAGDYRMSIGLRDNPEQRAVFLFALNSGERCVRREDWNALPTFYKKGFRIETGLNMQSWMRGDRLLYQRFSYRQTLRERKYGIIIGLRGRLRMSADVALSWFYGLGRRILHEV